MRILTAATSLAAMTLLASCSSTTAAPSTPPGPVQDLTLTGASTITWTTSSGPQGSLPTAPPTEHATTGCYTWTDAAGKSQWAARITGTATGHALVLKLDITGSSAPPMGTHSVALGSRSPDTVATLTVDGTDYPEVHTDPADAQPSYFTLDDDGTTGRISIRFAATQNGPQAYDAEGRWHCV